MRVNNGQIFNHYQEAEEKGKGSLKGKRGPGILGKIGQDERGKNGRSPGYYRSDPQGRSDQGCYKVV